MARPIGPAHQQLGSRLRWLRTNAGRSLRDLEVCSPGHLSQVENGALTPSSDLVSVLVQVLGGSQEKFSELLNQAVIEARSLNAKKRRNRRDLPLNPPDDPPSLALPDLGPADSMFVISGVTHHTKAEDTVFSAGDVLVIGAGASGILAARALLNAGFSATLMDAVGLGAAQSNHSHGYMHRGHIYGKPSPELVKALCEGADQWTDLLGQAKVTPHAEQACVGFSNAYAAQVADAAWRRAGLTFEVTDPPPGVAPHYLRRCFSTQEPTFCFTPWFAYASKETLCGVVTVKGVAESLEREGHLITGVRSMIAGRKVIVRARFYVLAAGTGNLPLISSATNYRGRALNRMSFMMVLKRQELPNLSLVIPEHDAYGLFLVSRHKSGHDHWLVSNYLSYADSTCSAKAASLWLRATARLLKRTTTVLEGDPQWGMYLAPKGELRADRNRLDVQSVQSYGLSNVCVAAPTKLTLCPLLAIDIVRCIKDKISVLRSQSDGEDCAVISSDLPVSPERWESTQLFQMDDLRRIMLDPRHVAGAVRGALVNY